MPHALTVGQLLHQLQTLDPDLPAHLAVNPDWSYAHRIGRAVALTKAGRGAVYVCPPSDQCSPRRGACPARLTATLISDQ